jgi:23S rRNA (uracil1939-C5)-methyltransferase
MPPVEPVILTIDRVGVRGDGITQWQGQSVYVPFTAPGDVVRVTLGTKRGQGHVAVVKEIVVPGARAAPLCRHFGACGGCALQHLDEAAYLATKTQWLEEALAQQRLTPDSIAPIHALPAATRRRARFQITPQQVGFHERGSHRLINLQECHVLHPDLMAIVRPLRTLARAILTSRQTGEASVTLTPVGLDLLLDLPAVPDLGGLEMLAHFADSHDLARLAWRHDGEMVPVAIRRKPQAILSGVAVDLPSDAFLQASIEAEAALTEAVLAMSNGAKAVADLYAGLGTFTFALARGAKVHAVEAAGGAVTSLIQAAARGGLAGTVTAERRDLAVRPLGVHELASFDTVVFDPPYAGAKEQCQVLAASSIRHIVAVSCNPASFARDARILVDGGYHLAEIRPFDAFLWSANLEVVARFERR